MPLRRRPAAIADVDEIWGYITERNEAAADRLIEAFTAAAERIEESPYIGAQRKDVAKTARGYLVSSYIILYRVDDDGVEIVRVVHGARDLRAFAGDFAT